LALEHR